jgi:imidazole glycerol-phosphate synthase subunit HisH
MQATKVCVIQTGVANTASVNAAFHRMGVDVEFVENASDVSSAEMLVLPGVGSFGAGMSFINKAGLIDPIRERVAERKPTLAICLGFQLLFNSSEESVGVDGVGAIDGSFSEFPDTVCSPQFGWNSIQTTSSCEILESGFAYFANTYRLGKIPDGWSGAQSNHGGQFVAAIESGPVLGCQFHPEISGEWGRRLLGRWVEKSKEYAHAY